MNRIDFLKQMFCGGAMFFMPKSTREETRVIRLCSPYIAGFQYYKGHDIEQLLRENDQLNLKREARNQHDCYAIEVFQGNNKLGYLPREENKVIARMMDQGIEIKAKITAIHPEAHPYRKVKLMVFCSENNRFNNIT